MGKVFISYSHKDQDFVKEINRLLESNYILTWFDEKNIREGDRWETHICTTISACNTFLVFHSRNYECSKYCQKEWELMVERESESAAKILLVGLDDFKDSFVVNSAKAIQFVKFDYKRDSAQDLLKTLMLIPAILDCKISKQYSANYISSTSFFNAIGNLHKPKHYALLEMLLNFAMEIKQKEDRYIYIADTANFSSLQCFDYGNNVYKLSLIGENDYTNLENHIVRNRFLKNVFYAMFKFGNTTFKEIPATDLEFEFIFKSGTYHFIKNFDAQEDIVASIYGELNRRISALYKSFESLNELIEGLYDILNGSKYFEDQEVYYGMGQSLVYEITPTVIAIARMLSSMSNKNSYVKTNDIYFLDEKGNVVNAEELYKKTEDLYIKGNYGIGKTMFLQNWFKSNPYSFYIDVSMCSQIGDIDIIKNIILQRQSYGLRLNYFDLYNYSAYTHEITLLIDNVDGLSKHDQERIMAEISILMKVFQIVIVSSNYYLENKLAIKDNYDSDSFARFEILPLKKEQIIQYIKQGLATKIGAASDLIVARFEELDDNDQIFKFFDNYTKLSILLEIVPDWTSFSIEKFKSEFNSKITVYQRIFESQEHYSLQKKMSSYFQGLIVDIDDIIMNTVKEEIDFLKRAAYEMVDISKAIEHIEKTRFRDFYPVLTKNSERYYFINNDIKSYFIASYINSIIINPDNKLSLMDLFNLLGKVKDDYEVLEYLYEFDILQKINDNIEELEYICEANEKYEQLVLVLYKISQYYPDDSFKLMFIGNIRFDILPDKFFFRADNIEKIIVPPSVKEIGRACFSNMPKLREIDFASPLLLGLAKEIEIKPWAIINCPNLKKIHLGANYIRYNSPLFSRCNNLEMLEVDEENPNFSTLFENKILANKDGTEIYCALNALRGVLKLPDGVRILHTNSLSYLNNVIEIKLPSTVIEADTNFTDFCDCLQRIDVETSNKTFFSDENGFMYTIKNGQCVLFRVPSGIHGKLAIPSHVVCIGSDSISCCTHVTDIFIPKSIKEIENYAFADTYALENIIFEDMNGVEFFGNYLFLSSNVSARIIGKTQMSLETFNDIYCKNKSDVKLRGRVRKNITSSMFSDVGFEIIREGNVNKEYKNIVIVRDITLFNNKQYYKENCNILLLGMTEYNSILLRNKLEANQYFEDLVTKSNISIVALTRDLPLVSQLEDEKYKDLMVIRSGKSSTSATKLLSKIIDYLETEND